MAGETVSSVAYGPSWQRDDTGRWLLPTRTLGWGVLAWTAHWLRQPDGPEAGQPWRYTDEQARLILWWYAVDEAGRFVYRYGVLRRAKGWGKDPFAASLACVEFVGPCRFSHWTPDGQPIGKPHPAAWVQVAAVSRDQTRNTMTVFPGLLSPEAIAAYDMDLGKEIIYAHRGRCRIEAVTSSPRSLEGGRSTFVIKNETHHWLLNNDGHQMSKVIARNLGKSRDGSARALSITNAHLPGEDSDAERDYESFEKHRTGRINASDRFYDSLEAPPGLDPSSLADARTGIIAARGDSTWLDPIRIGAEFVDRTQLTEAEAQRFYWNVVAGSDAAWVDVRAWRECERPTEVEDGTRVCLGFDGSIREDSTALIACRLSDGYLWPLATWERPRGPAGSGWQVPRTEVDAAVADAFERYTVVRMYADPPHWQDYVDKWAGQHGEKVVLEFWTMSAIRLGKALERLHTAILTGEVSHDGNPVLDRHIGNAMVKRTSGYTLVTKRTQDDKIDALVAATLAYEARNDSIADGALTTTGANFWAWDDL